MRNLQIAFLFVLISTFPAVVFSQGYYLERGQSGFGVSGGFSSNKDASLVSGSVGYSAAGTFDFGLSVSQISFADKFLGEEITAMSRSPYVTVHAVKQNETTPFSVALSASYVNDTYSSRALDDNNLEMFSTGYTIGLALYGDVVASPTMKVQPKIGIKYFDSEAEIKDNVGNSITAKEDGTIVGLGFALLFQATSQSIFGISPSVSVNKSNKSFSIDAGFIFIL